MTNDSHAEFVLESREHLQVFERSMLALELAQTAQDVCECIDKSLRAMHSLKGNAGFLGFQTIQKIAHATESVLENYHNQTFPPPVSVVEALLLANDRLAAMLDDLDHCQAQNISSELETLRSLALDTTSANASGDRTKIQLRLRWPDPSATILPLFESLFTLGSLSGVQLTAQDLRRNVNDWQGAGNSAHLQPSDEQVGH